MDYPLLRTLHIATVHLTLILFLLRGFWMLVESRALGTHRAAHQR